MVTNKKISQKREKSIGKQIGGHAHIASGALWFQKGDVSNEHIIIEDKFTHSNSYGITLSVLTKIDKEGRKNNKIPLLSIGFHQNNFSVACVDSNYIREEILSSYNIIPIATSNKSYTVNYLNLKELYLGLTGQCLPLLAINFEAINRVFYILEWTEFIENLESIIYY